MVAFDFCLEEPASGSVTGVGYEIDGEGGITLDPWPLTPAELDGFIAAFLAEGYPDGPAPVLVPFWPTGREHIIHRYGRHRSQVAELILPEAPGRTASPC